MIIGLLGGTFNPPHNGHLAIAQQVMDFTDCNEVWFVPGYQHSFQKPAAPVADRLAMTTLLTHNPKMSVCTLETDHKLDGETIHTLPLLPKEHEYRFIMGSDQLPTFHLWGLWEKLLTQIPFLVFPRYGYPNEPLYPGMTMVNDPSLIVSNISSTKVRERVFRGLPIDQFVPKEVAEYIHAHQLYKL